jgi:O-antigen ligase
MIAYQASPVFHGRVDRGVSEVRQFQNNPNTSVGLRLLFWQNSWEIITNNLWIGVGTGDFPTAYATINRKNSPRFVATDNPHNQFILAGCQLGLLGITSLMAIFIIQIIQGKLRTLSPYGDGWQRVRLAFPVFFLTIMLTESYLIIASTGFLFSLFSAVFYISVSPEPDCHH